MCQKGAQSCRLLIQAVQRQKRHRSTKNPKQKHRVNSNNLQRFQLGQVWRKQNCDWSGAVQYNRILPNGFWWSVSVLNVNTYKKLNSPRLQKCDRLLHAFGQQQIPVLGELHTVAKCGNKLANVVIILANVENSNICSAWICLKHSILKFNKSLMSLKSRGLKWQIFAKGIRRYISRLLVRKKTLRQAFTLNRIPY